MLSSAKLHATYQVWQEFGKTYSFIVTSPFLYFFLYLLLAKHIWPACNLADTITLPWVKSLNLSPISNSNAVERMLGSHYPTSKSLFSAKTDKKTLGHSKPEERQHSASLDPKSFSCCQAQSGHLNFALWFYRSLTAFI